MDEHQDDLAPEVQEGDEFETETYVPESSEDGITDEPEHQGPGDNTAEQDHEPLDGIQRSRQHVKVPVTIVKIPHPVHK